MKRAKLLVTLDDETRYVPVLAGLSIGRDPKNDLIISARGVGNVHCTIAWKGDKLVLTPEATTSKIRVNGRPSGERALKTDDVVVIGPASLRVQIEGEKSAVTTLETGPSAGAPKNERFYLEAVDPAGKGAQVFRDAVRISDRSMLLLVGNLERGGLTDAVLAMLRDGVRGRAKRDQGPTEVLRTLNRDFCERKLRGTATAAKVTFADGALVCASAGHAPPMLVSSGGVTPVKLNASARLGTLPSADFKSTSLRPDRGEVLVLTSSELAVPLEEGVVQTGSAAKVAGALRALGLQGTALALQL
jgi:hypothetical protein